MTDSAESRRLDLYAGSTNPGPHYAKQPFYKSSDGSTGPQTDPTPALNMGQRVRHAKSGEQGVVTGVHVHHATGEQFPTVRWDGQPSKGFTQDQGYSLDNLTTP